MCHKLECISYLIDSGMTSLRMYNPQIRKMARARNLTVTFNAMWYLKGSIYTEGQVAHILLKRLANLEYDGVNILTQHVKEEPITQP
jgi:hypothetical protein